MMFNKWFSCKEKKEEVLLSPLSGKVLRLDDVPDPLFSFKRLGEGIAIEPMEGKVNSPVDGEIIQTFPTQHAIVIRSECGLEILIHIGLDTVFMQGESFHTFVKKGDHVKSGQLLINFSLDLVKQRATSSITPMVILNSDRIDQLQIVSPTLAQKGKTELMIIKVK